MELGLFANVELLLSSRRVPVQHLLFSESLEKAELGGNRNIRSSWINGTATGVGLRYSTYSGRHSALVNSCVPGSLQHSFGPLSLILEHELWEMSQE